MLQDRNDGEEAVKVRNLPCKFYGERVAINFFGQMMFS